MVLFNRRKYMGVRRSPQGAPLNLADAVITVAESVQYTGSPRTPSVTVVYDGTTLVANTDYFVAYNDNTNVGAATVVVTGTGSFTGTVVKTFQITSASPSPASGWADFDLTKLGSAVDTASLYDSGATFCSSEKISLYGIQTLPDDSIFFGAQAQGHPYVWGFDTGHAFEVGHFLQSPTSRGRSTANYACAVLADEGSVLYDVDTNNSSTNNYKTLLDAPYSLQTENSRVFIGNYSLLGNTTYRMQFSNDGTRLFFKYDSYNKNVYYVDMTTPFDISSHHGVNSFDLDAFSSQVGYGFSNAYAFQFSPDGKALVFTCAKTSSMWPSDWDHYVVKLSLSTAYDLSTASVHSYKRLSNGSPLWQGVAVNNAGTKMILFKWSGTDTRDFYEYNLST